MPCDPIIGTMLDVGFWILDINRQRSLFFPASSIKYPVSFRYGATANFNYLFILDPVLSGLGLLMRFYFLIRFCRGFHFLPIIKHGNKLPIAP